MISKIYFDNDQTLSHTEYGSCGFGFEYDFEFFLGDSYFTKVNPYALSLLKFARDLVGEENVFMLTYAHKDFATKVSNLAGFNFPEQRILSIEDINRFHKTPKYRRSNTHECKRNVLIDNMFPRDNEEKMIFLGIGDDWERRYCKVPDFYGIPTEDFEQRIVEFLKRAHEDL